MIRPPLRLDSSCPHENTDRGRGQCIFRDNAGEGSRTSFLGPIRLARRRNERERDRLHALQAIMQDVLLPPRMRASSEVGTDVQQIPHSFFVHMDQHIDLECRLLTQMSSQEDPDAALGLGAV